MEVEYRQLPGNPTNIHWIQIYTTNVVTPGTYVWGVDALGPTPFYDDAGIANSTGLVDGPNRKAELPSGTPQPDQITWSANLFPVTVDSDNNVIIWQGFTWGWRASPTGATINNGQPGFLNSIINVDSSQPSVPAGQPITFTALVSCGPPAAPVVPTGSVEFYDGAPAAGGVLLGTVALHQNAVDGEADLTLNNGFNTTGNHFIYAVYTAVGDTHYWQSNNYAVQTVTGWVMNVAPPAASVAGGTAVTISGAGFTGTTQVYFGSVAASYFTVNLDTQITAVSPTEAPGTVDVTVVGLGGVTSATSSADQFTYVAAPGISGITPSSGPISGGTTVSITGTNFTGASAVKFGNTPAANFTVISSTQITAIAPMQSAGTVDVTVTTAGGSSPPQQWRPVHLCLAQLVHQQCDDE